ncbi:MAG TPA: hypothetical protein VFP10_04995, partial [Candidatus Eisenbacteria bacterium]|nr:hypothetical protein [Candidatus Eisenbacteria bacterium]
MRDLIRVWFISAVLLAVPQTARQAVVDLRLGSDVTPFVDQTEHSTLRVGSQSSSAAIPSFSG